MRQKLIALAFTASLVGILSQFERPAAQAVAIPDSETQVPFVKPPAPVKPEAKPVAKPAAGPIRYVWGKISCDANGCKMGWKPVQDSASAADDSCGCNCGNCHCGQQQADPVRRTFFGRRFSGRGLFGGRLFSGRLLGRGCGR